MALWKSSRLTGSSPLTRGKPNVSTSVFIMVGLIPAHAGKTRGVCPSKIRNAAHPRSRGENLHICRMTMSWHGSSPLTRGKPKFIVVPCSFPGLIPAHAGKTPGKDLQRYLGLAHPRSRGENADGAGQLVEVRRLIPAHAGKTGISHGALTPSSAHPRSRGENRRLADRITKPAGSSPLTRGKLASHCPAYDRDRLIPAHAGKTVFIAGWILPDWAHPRSRGENETV